VLLVVQDLLAVVVALTTLLVVLVVMVIFIMEVLSLYQQVVGEEVLLAQQHLRVQTLVVTVDSVAVAEAEETLEEVAQEQVVMG
jgi:hypothetical protein